MKKPTQQQLNKFWDEATQRQLRDIMEYTKDKEVRDKAISRYKWEEATEWQLRDIMRYTKNKEVRDKAEKHLPYDVEGKDYNTPHRTDWNKVFEKFAIFIMIFAVLYFGLHLFAFVVYQLAN